MEKDTIREAWKLTGWPESYYEPIEGGRRKKLLDQAMQEEDSKENQIRLKLWEYRYGKVAKNGGKPEVDYYIRFLMNLRFATAKINSIFSSTSIVKELRQDLKKMGVEEMKQMGDSEEALLYKEFVQLGRFYLDLCTKDKNYTTTCMGIVSLKEDKLYDKIAEDVYRIAYKGPKALGLDKELSVFTKAFTEAFETEFAEESMRLQKLICQKQA